MALIISKFKNRPTIVTIDVTNSPSLSRRSTLSRSSSYSGYSAQSATSTGSSTSRNPIDRVRTYSAASTDSIFPSPTMMAVPVYSPPPNTPATFEPIHQIHDYSKLNLFAFESEGITQRGTAGEKGQENNDPFNPFSYTGPIQYPNHSSQGPVQQTNGFQGVTYEPNLPSQGTLQSSGSSIVDLEKARGFRRQDTTERRHCGRKIVICCIIMVIFLLLAIAAVVIVVVKLRHHFKHHKRMACFEVPGLYVQGNFQPGYIKCT
jgi:hypothetical protein